MMSNEASIPWVSKTFPKVPEFLVPRIGTTIAGLNVWSKVANTVPLSPAELTTRSMASSMIKGFLAGVTL